MAIFIKKGLKDLYNQNALSHMHHNGQACIDCRLNDFISHVESLEKTQEEDRERLNAHIGQYSYEEPVHEEFCQCDEPEIIPKWKGKNWCHRCEMPIKPTDDIREGDLVSNCCASDFDPMGYEKEEGIWQERCLNCKRLCEPLYIGKRDIENIHRCLRMERNL
jgi:hypothetical protein